MVQETAGGRPTGRPRAVEASGAIDLVELGLDRLAGFLGAGLVGQAALRLGRQDLVVFVGLEEFRAEHEVYTSPNRQVVPDSTLDTVELAGDKADRKVADKARAERARLLQIEMQKIRGYLTTFSALSPREQAAQKQALRPSPAELFSAGRRHFRR